MKITSQTPSKEESILARQQLYELFSNRPFDDADIYLIAGIIFKIIENFDKSKFYLNKAAALGDKDAIRVLSTLK